MSELIIRAKKSETEHTYIHETVACSDPLRDLWMNPSVTLKFE